MKTQRDRILQFLNESDWICGQVFLGAYISEYRSRINELRKDGFTIEARKCQNPAHKHRGGLQEWHLARNGIFVETAPRTPFPIKDPKWMDIKVEYGFRSTNQL